MHVRPIQMSGIFSQLLVSQCLDLDSELWKLSSWVGLLFVLFIFIAARRCSRMYVLPNMLSHLSIWAAGRRSRGTVAGMNVSPDWGSSSSTFISTAAFSTSTIKRITEKIKLGCLALKVSKSPCVGRQNAQFLLGNRWQRPCVAKGNSNPCNFPRFFLYIVLS